MKTQTLFAFLALVFFFILTDGQKALQEPNGNLVVPPLPIEIDEMELYFFYISKNEIHHDDPFAKRTSPEHGKKRHPRNDHNGFPSDNEAEQVWQTYKPFVYEDDEEKEQREHSSRINTHEFNEILKWGMLAGTAFLAFVLIKTCTKKRGRREMRRVMEEAQRRRQNFSQNNPNVYFYQLQPQVQALNPIQKQSEENLDDKIIHAEMELNRLKELKQQSMRQEFNRKKIEEEQKRIEMVNVQRKQAFQPRQNNWNVGYGPVFYGQETIHYAQPQAQQPFHIQGIEPIRQRSNSFKTEMSEQPILNNQIKYRNGIPVGKPIRQHDNDSSFASEYPDV